MSEALDSEAPDGDQNPRYLIDETVELEEYWDDNGDNRGYVWELDEDLDPDSEYVVRAIARDGGQINVHLLPAEEAEAFRQGDNFWPEWTSNEGDKISANVSVETDDEEPYYHSGDLKVAVDGHIGTPSRVTMKFRQAD